MKRVIPLDEFWFARKLKARDSMILDLSEEFLFLAPMKRPRSILKEISESDAIFLTNGELATELQGNE
jgi:hypothetical protein